MHSNTNPAWFRLLPFFLRKRLDGRKSLHSIIHNTGWLLGDKGIRLGMGLLVGAWVARYLGPSQYGELSYVLAFVAFFQVISELGLNGIAIRDMARERQASPVILGTVFRLRLITGLLCWFTAISLMAFLRPGDLRTLLLTAIISGSLVFQAADTVDLWFQSQTQSRRTVAAKILSYLASSLFKVALILSKASLFYFAIAGLAEIVLSAIGLYFSYRRFPASLVWRWDLQRGKQLINESWPYMLSGLSIIIYMRSDQIMLREMLGTHELGIFSAVIPLSTTWYFIPIIISQSFGPSIAKMKESDLAGYERTIDRLFSIMWWIMLPLSTCIGLLSVPIVHLLYGEEYTAAAQVLAVHIFINIPVGLGVMQAIWILNERKYKMVLIKNLLGGFTNISINLLLIPKYGALGAAVGTLIAQSISGVFSNIILAPIIFRRQLKSLFYFKF